jgi:hypothetical protein
MPIGPVSAFIPALGRATGLSTLMLWLGLGLVGCTRPALPTADSSLRPKTLTFSILEDYVKGEDLAEVARDFALFRELNVTTWRGSFGWDAYEPERGRYDFAWLHAFMETAERREIALRPYVAHTPAWAAGREDRDGLPWNQPPRDVNAWAAFIAALAREIGHHPGVRSLEIYNEQNVPQRWEGSVGDYAATLRAAAAAAPGRDLIMGGLVFPDADWIEGLCSDRRARSAFTVLPIHAYPETWTPDGVTVENYLGEGFRTRFLPAADRACGPKRIWINEAGFATAPGRTELSQAAWWVRAIATFAAEPRVEHIGIYEIKDLAPDRPAIGDAPRYHLGLTRVDRTRKLAFTTVRLMVSLLGGQAFTTGTLDVRRRAGAGELHHRAFVRQDRSILVVIWNRTADEIVTVGLPGASHAVEFGLDGRSVEHPLRGPELELRLDRGVPRVFLIDSGLAAGN